MQSISETLQAVWANVDTNVSPDVITQVHDWLTTVLEHWMHSWCNSVNTAGYCLANSRDFAQSASAEAWLIMFAVAFLMVILSAKLTLALYNRNHKAQ